MRLLIVDDHAPMRRTLRELVSRDGVDVFEAEDGEAACSSHARCRPDWTIMDLRMPRLGGLEATRRIVRDVPGARVVIVTQHDEPGLRAAAEAAGAVGFVPKDRLHELDALIGGRTTA